MNLTIEQADMRRRMAVGDEGWRSGDENIAFYLARIRAAFRQNLRP
jgi:hypothetical protein